MLEDLYLKGTGYTRTRCLHVIFMFNVVDAHTLTRHGARGARSCSGRLSQWGSRIPAALSSVLTALRMLQLRTIGILNCVDPWSHHIAVIYVQYIEHVYFVVIFAIVTRGGTSTCPEDSQPPAMSVPMRVSVS